MRVHEFVNGNKPVMVFIHGVLCPWKIWTPQIEAFKDEYNIYAIALNAHTEDVASEFTTFDDQVEEIVQYFLKSGIVTINVLCGISFGGKIAHAIWRDGRIVINNLVMDGAPLLATPKIAERIMIRNYTKIIHQSKAREPKVLASYKKNFLPEKYLDDYLKIADYMTDESMKNVVVATFGSVLRNNVENNSNILFIHGTKSNEIISKRVAKLMKKYYPETKVICFKGDTHCHKVVYEPEKWIEAVREFLRGCEEG